LYVDTSKPEDDNEQLSDGLEDGQCVDLVRFMELSDTQHVTSRPDYDDRLKSILVQMNMMFTRHSGTATSGEPRERSVTDTGAGESSGSDTPKTRRSPGMPKILFCDGQKYGDIPCHYNRTKNEIYINEEWKTFAALLTGPNVPRSRAERESRRLALGFHFLKAFQGLEPLNVDPTTDNLQIAAAGNTLAQLIQNSKAIARVWSNIAK